MATYTIEALDSEGYELTREDEDTLKAAKDRARYYMSAAYQKATESLEPVAKVRVSRNGECVFDLYR